MSWRSGAVPFPQKYIGACKVHEVALPMPRPTAQVAPYVEVLGADLAVDFILQFGGADLYLPKKPQGRSEVEKLLGQDKLKQLAARIGEIVRVPLAKRWLTEMLFWKGYSKAAIARTLRTSENTVRNYLAGKYSDHFQS